MKITCHMIMSVDGRLISKYWSPLYNASSSVTEVYEAADAKLSADGWIVGRKTMAEYGADVVEEKEPMEGHKTMQTNTFIGKREGRPLAVVFDIQGRLHYKSPTLPQRRTYRCRPRKPCHSCLSERTGRNRRFLHHAYTRFQA